MPATPLTPAQLQVVRGLPGHLDVSRVERLWIFDPQLGKTRETGLVVVSLRDEQRHDAELRSLVTVRYVAEQRKEGLHVEESVTEEGWAPPDSIQRVIAGVLSRGGEDAGEPLEEQLEPGEESWGDLLNRLEQSG